jgi:hypothetical protein
VTVHPPDRQIVPEGRKREPPENESERVHEAEDNAGSGDYKRKPDEYPG